MNNGFKVVLPGIIRSFDPLLFCICKIQAKLTKCFFEVHVTRCWRRSKFPIRNSTARARLTMSPGRPRVGLGNRNRGPHRRGPQAISWRLRRTWRDRAPGGAGPAAAPGPAPSPWSRAGCQTPAPPGQRPAGCWTQSPLRPGTRSLWGGERKRSLKINAGARAGWKGDKRGG